MWVEKVERDKKERKKGRAREKKYARKDKWTKRKV